MKLKDKVMIITGAAGGIGSATAKLLNKAGVKLVLTDLDETKLQKLADSLENAVIHPGDITKKETAKQLINKAIESFGQLDMVFNNAGIMIETDIENADVDKLDLMIQINFQAVVRLSYAALKHFYKTGRGFVLNMSSFAGVKPSASFAAYSGSKFAIEAFTDSIRMELARYGDKNIGIAVIEAGTVDTGLYNDWDADKRDYVYSGGALQPEDIARCAKFILEQPDHMRVERILAIPKKFPV